MVRHSVSPAWPPITLRKSWASKFCQDDGDSLVIDFAAGIVGVDHRWRGDEPESCNRDMESPSKRWPARTTEQLVLQEHALVVSGLENGRRTDRATLR